MTDRSLAQVYAVRQRAWQRLGECRIPLGSLLEISSSARKLIDDASYEFREAGRLIVNELILRGRPARIETVEGEWVELRLTKGAKHFVVVQAERLVPAWSDSNQFGGEPALYDYAAACPN